MSSFDPSRHDAHLPRGPIDQILDPVIGFTMALFIAGLIFDGAMLNAAKIGVLTASAVCAAGGMLMLLWLQPTPGAKPAG
jgi:Na+/H+ antiporter NhaA